MRTALLAVAVCLALPAFGQDLLSVRDLGFQRKPFNPGDSGVIQRVELRDNDAGNRDDVYLTKLTVENLGTATPDEIAQVEVRMETERGTFVLAQADSFPITAILLPLPAEQRSVPDDSRALLMIWVQVGDRLTDGHTIQPQVHIWYSERGEGGEAQVQDGAPETLIMEGSFLARALPGPQGGVLNPGDAFPIMEFQVEDTPDINFLDLEIIELTLDAPNGLVYELYNNASRLELTPGRTLRVPEGYFAAVDEGVGTLYISVRVPPEFSARAPVTVAPSLSFVVREGDFTKRFQVSDPTPDTVVIAGAEELSVQVPQGGQVLTRPPAQLQYSRLTITDQDRNATALRLDSLALVAKGTVASQIVGIEITDSQGNLLAYQDRLGEIPLIDPSGRPLSVSDDSSRTLVSTLTLQGPFPVGASLLLEHRVKLAEIHPYQVTTTYFAGIQAVTPARAIFFGQPEFELKPREQGVEVWTTGETIASLVLSLRYSPTQSVSVVALTPTGGWRIKDQAVDPQAGLIELELGLRPGRSPQAGKVLEVQWTLVGRVDTYQEVTAQLSVERVEDTAGIELPHRVRTSSARFTLTAPHFSLGLTEEGLVELAVDMPEIGAIEGVLYFTPPALAGGVTMEASDGYQFALLAPEPEAGTLAFRLELVSGAVPVAGPLFRLTFAPAEELPAPWGVRVSLTGVWDQALQPLPYILEPAELEIPVPG